MNKPRVKICGITSVADGIQAAGAGADAIGLVFYEPSPRYVTIETAVQIAAAAGPFVTLVGLFVNADAQLIERVLQQVPLHMLQFHGDETADFCQQFNRPYLKAIRMRDDVDVLAEIDHYPTAAGILLDAYKPGVPGGTGGVFDWRRVPTETTRAIVLAGGLTPENVAGAVAQTRPYAVDVSGGVESEPGRKHPEKVAAFIRNATQPVNDHVDDNSTEK